MDLLASALVYLGLLAVVVGAIRWRKRGLRMAAAGVLAVFAGFLWPAHLTRVREVRTRLDEFVPVYQFSEFHSIRIAAPPERVYRAIQDVCPEEIAFYQTLTWIRRFGRRGSEGILNAPPRQPLLETATRKGFIRLVDDPGREIAIGVAGAGKGSWAITPQDFQALDRPLMIKIGMNFRIEEEDAGHCLLTTETRVSTVGRDARRGFQVYWRLIYPGSSTIRYMWLRAIRERAELAARS